MHVRFFEFIGVDTRSRRFKQPLDINVDIRYFLKNYISQAGDI